MLYEEGEVAGGVLLIAVRVDPELPGGRLTPDIDCELVLNAGPALELVQTLNKPAANCVDMKKTD